MLATTAMAAPTTNKIRTFGTVSGRNTEEEEGKEEEDIVDVVGEGDG